VGRHSNETVARGNIQKVQSVCAQPPQPLARAEGVCWNIYLANLYIIELKSCRREVWQVDHQIVITYK
jgi:hypothetical protein